VGNYIFGDLNTGSTAPDGSLFAAVQQSDGTWTMRRLSISGTANNRLGRFLKGIEQDAQGELYLLLSQNIGPSGTGGEVVKISPGQ
jgi:hypothetical protein